MHAEGPDLVNKPKNKRANTVASYRGSKAHDYDWLKVRYFESGGPHFPSEVSKCFSLVDTWTTDLRYKAGTTKYGDAEAFLQSAGRILNWAEGRF